MESNNNADTAESVSSRRLKKRESDRRCQRMARERTKARIQYLESLVEDFREQDSSGQVASLMQQLTFMENERDKLAKILKDVQKALGSLQEASLIQNNTGSPEIHGSTAENQAPEHIATTRTQIADNIGLQSWPNPPLSSSGSNAWNSGPADASGAALKDSASVLLEQTAIETGPDLSVEGDPIVPQPSIECECSPKELARIEYPRNLWRFANETLIERFNIDQPDMSLEDAISDDTPIRAIIEGWEAVNQRSGLSPTWRILRRIDEVLFTSCADTERLAIMRVMHLLLLYHLDPTPERYKRLPVWYQKRPSQTLVHSYAIDFFAWPGLRERFVFNQHRYCSNMFWHLFCNSLRIQWPFEFRDCYTHNLQTGTFEFSTMFGARLHDINTWAMGPDMFSRWPELSSDIPYFNRIPGTIGAAPQCLTEEDNSEPSTEPCVEQGQGIENPIQEGLGEREQDSLSLTFPVSQPAGLELDATMAAYFADFGSVRGTPSWMTMMGA